MADPTLAELDARLRVVEAKLGIGAATPPSTPGPITATTLADGRIQLDWPNPGDADTWDVLDTLNPTEPLKETVTVPVSIRSPIKVGARRGYALRARNAAGVSALSPVLYLPAAGDPPPATGIDLVPWYLTLPTGTSGSPDTVHQPALATYSSKYFERQSDGSIACRVWHGGVTTSGSANPRTELRECNRDGTHAAWSSTSGRHRMVIEGQVNRLTKVRPYTVIGQIHSATDDVTVFRVEGSNLWITNGNTPHGYLLDSAFALGKRYQIGFDVSGGVVSFLYNDALVPFTLRVSTEGNYFKAGAYLQSNPTTAPGESTSEWTEVVIYSVAVSHT